MNRPVETPPRRPFHWPAGELESWTDHGTTEAAEHLDGMILHARVTERVLAPVGMPSPHGSCGWRRQGTRLLAAESLERHVPFSVWCTVVGIVVLR